MNGDGIAKVFSLGFGFLVISDCLGDCLDNHFWFFTDVAKTIMSQLKVLFLFFPWACSFWITIILKRS
jgi:hypothetical protein